MAPVCARSRRLGFTLVELLVVIAIIGILVGLLLPAVQAAREAARRMQCTNNLKQIALALHNYESAMKRFPQETYYNQRADGSFFYGSWIPQILPFFEQSALANLYDHNSSFFEPNNRQAIETKLQLFECPASPGGTQLTKKLRMRLSSGWVIQEDRGAFTADYAGQRGINAATYRIYVPGGTSPANEGIFTQEKGATIASIADGTSNTIIIHESAGRANWLRRDRTQRTLVSNPPEFGGWFDYWAGPCAGWMYGFEDNGLTTLGPRFINASNKWANPFSFHVGGVNIALADGSVRSLSDTMNNVTFIGLTTLNSGEVLQEF